MNQVLPKYKCHKEVHAVKIETIMAMNPLDDASFLLVPVDKDINPIKVDARYMEKHKPGEGGYYVIYEDGYESFSPEQAFEAGYTLIETNS